MSEELKAKARKLGQLLANSTIVSLDQKMQILGQLKGFTEKQIDEITLSLEESNLDNLQLVIAK
jgi:hypothetical protein